MQKNLHSELKEREEEVKFLLDVLSELDQWLTQNPNKWDIDYQRIETIEKKYDYHFHHKIYEEGKRERRKQADECYNCAGRKYPASDYCSGCNKLFYR